MSHIHVTHEFISLSSCHFVLLPSFYFQSRTSKVSARNTDHLSTSYELVAEIMFLGYTQHPTIKVLCI